MCVYQSQSKKLFWLAVILLTIILKLHGSEWQQYFIISKVFCGSGVWDGWAGQLWIRASQVLAARGLEGLPWASSQHQAYNTAYRWLEAPRANTSLRRVAAAPPSMAQPQKSHSAVCDILCWSAQPQTPPGLSGGRHRPTWQWKEGHRTVDILFKKYHTGHPWFCIIVHWMCPHSSWHYL